MTIPSITTTGAAFVAAIEEAAKNPISQLELSAQIAEIERVVSEARRGKWKLACIPVIPPARVAEKQPEGKL